MNYPGERERESSNEKYSDMVAVVWWNTAVGNVPRSILAARSLPAATFLSLAKYLNCAILFLQSMNIRF